MKSWEELMQTVTKIEKKKKNYEWIKSRHKDKNETEK